jgi:hypothetical protein
MIYLTLIVLLVEPEGIEPLAATPLNNGYRVTAGNGGQAP